MSEKQDLIETINKIREEIGLEPYDVLTLQDMNEEELKRLYQRNLDLKGPVKIEKPKFNPKILLLVGIFVVISLAVGFIFLKQKTNPSIQYQISTVTTTTIDEILNIDELACACDIDPDVCEDPECYCDPLCSIN